MLELPLDYSEEAEDFNHIQDGDETHSKRRSSFTPHFKSSFKLAIHYIYRRTPCIFWWWIGNRFVMFGRALVVKRVLKYIRDSSFSRH